MKPLVAAVAVMAVALSTLPAAAQPGQDTSIRLPLDASEIREALGVVTTAPGSSVLEEIARRHFHLPGLRAASQPGLARLAMYVRNARKDGVGLSVPLPGGEAFWAEVTGLGGEALARGLLLERDVTLFHVALSSLDPGTLDYLLRNPDLAARLFRRHAPVFAAFGASIVVRGDRIELPGGADADPLWLRLTGTSPSNGARFIESLLAARRGRTAYFYDTLASLDAPRVAFVLGEDVEREDRFAAIAEIFETVDPTWRVDAQPFRRPPFDPSLALRFATVNDQGTLAGPEPLDALAYLRRLFGQRSADRRAPGAAAAARRAFDAMAAGQRLGRAAGEMRASRPSLALALERMGVRDDALFARVTRAASSLDARGPLGEDLIAIWQGALALLSAAARHGSLDAGARDAALTALADAAEAREPYAAVIDWLAARAVEGQLIDDALIAWSAGPSRPVPVTWEGELLVLDAARGRRAALSRVLDHPRRLTIDDILVLRDVQIQVSAMRPVDAARLAAQLAEVMPRYANAARAHALLGPGFASYSRLANRSAPTQAGIGVEGPARFALGQDLTAAWRTALADALRVMVYAHTIHAGNAAATSVADFARRHRFQPPERMSLAPAGPWEPGRVPADTTLRVEGSLLDLDLAVPEMRLRRVPEEMPIEPVMLAGERVALALNAVLAQDPSAGTSDVVSPSAVTAHLPLSGCPCLGPAPTPAAWRALAGRWDAGLLGATSSDLANRLTELTSAAGLPPALVAPLMLVATTDVIERADHAHPDERDALARASATIDLERLEQYMLVLIAEGTLGPAGGSGR